MTFQHRGPSTILWRRKDPPREEQILVALNDCNSSKKRFSPESMSRSSLRSKYSFAPSSAFSSVLFFRLVSKKNPNYTTPRPNLHFHRRDSPTPTPPGSLPDPPPPELVIGFNFRFHLSLPMNRQMGICFTSPSSVSYPF